MAVEGQKEADRQRMKTLLVEAIATLCRNGLQYEEDLCVEGLIGITVDKSDVFLVSVKETFSLKPEPEVKSGSERSQEVETPSSRKASKRSAPDDYEGQTKRRSKHRQYSGHSYEDDPGDKRDFDPGDQDENDDDDDDDIIFIDPSLEIKKEINKNEGDSSCMYSANQDQRVALPQRRPDVYDPRTSHPSGLDSDQLSATYNNSSVKQEHSSDSVRGNMDEYSANESPSTSTAQALEGFSDMQAYPVDWGNQSGQEFMSGDDSLLQSPHQASGSGGASQQVSLKSIKTVLSDCGKLTYLCPECDMQYTSSKYHVVRHYNMEHLGQRHVCPVCSKAYRYRWGLSGHIKRTHPEVLL